MQRAYLKPAPGLKIRDHVKKDLLPEQGREVTLDTEWRRRLADQDVFAGPPPRAAPKPKD